MSAAASSSSSVAVASTPAGTSTGERIVHEPAHPERREPGEDRPADAPAADHADRGDREGVEP